MRHDLEFLSIPRMVQVNAARYGDTEAVVDLDAEVRWSFAEVGERMVGSVRAAIAQDVRPGDRVALWGPNSADWIIAALGVLGAGAILVPLNTRFKGAEAAYVVERSGASIVLTVPDFAANDYVDMLRGALRPDSPVRNRLINLGPGTSSSGVMAWADYLAAGETVPVADALSRIDAIGPADVSDLMFTSGTTGAPKGVVLTHGQSLRAYGEFAAICTFAPGDRYLIIPPFFHTFGYKAGWMACLMKGVTLLPQSTFDVDTVLARLAAERVTILLGPPTLFTDIIRHPRRAEFDLSALRVTVPSAASVPVDLYGQLRESLGFDIVLSGYGLTEATSLVTMSRPEDDTADIADSVGRPIDDVEVTLVDIEGNPAPTGMPGEVLVRGYNVTRGYWEDPEATAQAIDAEGWLHTGDIGIINERGFLKIVDRKKDMFIVGGFNAYPAEIESVLRRHELVLDVAVIGAPDERLGEVCVAFVVAEPTLQPDDLITWARTQLANYKVPRRVVIIDELPRNSSMKVLKGKLRARVA